MNLFFLYVWWESDIGALHIRDCCCLPKNISLRIFRDFSHGKGKNAPTWFKHILFH